jgi:hypothetical protein
MKTMKRYALASGIALFGVVVLLIFFLLFHYEILTLPEEAGTKWDAAFLLLALSLLTLWGILLLYRMPNPVSWKLFFWILFLSQIWLFSGFLKRFTAFNSDAEIALWRFSYGPMLFMPGLWLSLVLYDFTRIPMKKLLWGLDGVAGLLFLLILSNEAHHWGWTPNLNAAGEILSWSNGPLYFIAVSYIFLLLGLSLFVLIYGTIHKRNGFGEVDLMLIPLGLLIAYSILYYTGVDFVRKTPFLNNYYIMDSLLGFLFMEMAFHSGLVQNSGFYRSFFVKGPYYLALVYPDYRIFERNESFTMVEGIKTQDEVVEAGHRYRKKALEGGYLILEEDISDILALQNELLEKQKQLRQTMKLLEGKQKVEEEALRLHVRDTINESLFNEIRLESAAIERLVSSLPDRLTPESRKSCGKTLESLQNRLAFLKQRCLFLINGMAGDGLSYEDFSLSQGSLNRDLSNVGFSLAVTYPSFPSVPLEEALTINAFLHSLVEAFGDSRGEILLSFDPEKKSLKARVVPTKEFQPEHVAFSPKVSEEDGEYFFALELGQ